MNQLGLVEVVRSVEGWDSLQADELLSVLQQENIPYQDASDFTWKGIALVWIPETQQRFGREGNRRLQEVLTQQGEDWIVSQLAHGMSLLDDEIQATLYALDQSEVVPGARHIARMAKRNISLLEKHQLETPTLPELELLLTQMKLALWKNTKEEQAWDRFQTYKVALTEYDGQGPEPEL